MNLVNINDECSVVLTQAGADYINSINTKAISLLEWDGENFKFNTEYAEGCYFYTNLMHVLELVQVFQSKGDLEFMKDVIIRFLD